MVGLCELQVILQGQMNGSGHKLSVSRGCMSFLYTSKLQPVIDFVQVAVCKYLSKILFTPGCRYTLS